MPYEMLTSQLGRSRRMDLVRYRCSCLGPVLVIAVVFVGMVGSERWRAFSAADVWTVYAGMGLEVLFRPGAVSFTFGTWRLEGEACIHGVFMTVLLVAGSYSSPPLSLAGEWLYTIGLRTHAALGKAIWALRAASQ